MQQRNTLVVSILNILCFILSNCQYFNTSDWVLHSNMMAFGFAIWNHTWVVFNGQTESGFSDQEFTITTTNINASNINASTANWNSRTIAYPVTSDGTPKYVWIGGQSQIQVSDIVYIFSASLDTPGITAQILLKYDLVNHAYIDTGTYNFQSIKGKTYDPCVVFNAALNAFYVIGGSTNSDNKNVYVSTQMYLLATDQWLFVADMNIGRTESGCAMNIFCSSAFIFGGYDGSDELASIEQYFNSNDSWIITPASLSLASKELKCILYKNVDNNIYCIAGLMVNIFNPDSFAIETVSLRIARSRFGLVLYNNCIYVFGGDSAGGSSDSFEYLCSPRPTTAPSQEPSRHPSRHPSGQPSVEPSLISSSPTTTPSTGPTFVPTSPPSNSPSAGPTWPPTNSPSRSSSPPTSARMNSTSEKLNNSGSNKDQLADALLFAGSVFGSCVGSWFAIFCCYKLYKRRQHVKSQVKLEVEVGDHGEAVDGNAVQVDVNNKTDRVAGEEEQSMNDDVVAHNATVEGAKAVKEEQLELCTRTDDSDDRQNRNIYAVGEESSASNSEDLYAEVDHAGVTQNNHSDGGTAGCINKTIA